ncbi:MAG: hypothetical protein KA104_03485 [Candidatus Pacebacteria bacterium]|nr:hypothetical protein [Candidatus Paceibacterota bacterium]
MKKISISLDTLRQMFRPGTHTFPARDWYILVGITMVLIGISGVYQAWTYYHTTAPTQSENARVEKPVFDADSIRAVEITFEKRKEEAERYRSTYHFVDPSR